MKVTRKTYRIPLLPHPGKGKRAERRAARNAKYWAPSPETDTKEDIK